MTSAPTGLVLDRVDISLRGKRIIAIDAAAPPGEPLSILGPSGCGKSTLLAAVAGTLDPVFRLSGRIILNGVDLTAAPIEERRIGIMFQDPLLFPHLTVGQNLSFGLSQTHRARAVRRAIVEDALGQIGLAGFYQRDPATLSGGQKTRVALMRMMMSDPRALLLDEAFSSLDAERKQQIRELVFNAARERDLPVLQVTHDESDAAAAGGEIFRIGS